MREINTYSRATIAKRPEYRGLGRTRTYKANLAQKPDTVDLSTKKENKNKKGKLAKFLAIGAAIAAVVAAGVAIYKGKGVKLSGINFNKVKSVKLSDINFNKGIALSKNGEKFTGKIKDKLAGGDKIIMEYVDGVLKSSSRKGKVNVKKVYETINNEKIVKKTVKGITSKFNLTKTQDEVNEAQSKLKSILADKKLTSAELKEQADAIQFKSKNQKLEIEKKINAKQKVETQASDALDTYTSGAVSYKNAKKAATKNLPKQAKKDNAKSLEEAMIQKHAAESKTKEAFVNIQAASQNAIKQQNSAARNISYKTPEGLNAQQEAFENAAKQAQEAADDANKLAEKYPTHQNKLNATRANNKAMEAEANLARQTERTTKGQEKIVAEKEQKLQNVREQMKNSTPEARQAGEVKKTIHAAETQANAISRADKKLLDSPRTQRAISDMRRQRWSDDKINAALNSEDKCIRRAAEFIVNGK